MTAGPSPRQERIRNRLAQLRRARDLTQEEVGRFLGLTVSMICKHETGDRRIRQEHAQNYAKLYRCTELELYLDPENIFESDANAD